MSKLTGWWDQRSDPDRIELYTRWSFPLFGLSEISVLVGPMTLHDTAAGLRIAGTLLVVGHAALCAVLSGQGLDWVLGRRERPARLATAVATLSVVGALTALALKAAGFASFGAAATVAGDLIAFGLGALVLTMRDIRTVRYCVPAAAAGASAASALLGMSGPDVAANAAIVLIAGGTLVGTNRYSAWLLGTVWELDAAREVQAQLAVTEERLRFGRDLHDVMGRNLAVIALKSELAVELARRGRPEAVEQMIEVQRLAQESQREVRDVVRGYRKADLAVELSGALSVLRAAGVESRAEWDEGGSGRALPAEVQAALAWVIREATTNVLRHSEAERCVIRLSVEDGGPGLTGVSGAVSGAVSSAVLSAVSSAVLSVENDGVAETSLSAGSGSRAETAETLESSEPSAAGEQGPGFASGSGLAGLRERLAVLDGTLRTESRAGSFRLTALVPLPLPLPRRDTSATAPSPRP